MAIPRFVIDDGGLESKCAGRPAALKRSRPADAPRTSGESRGWCRMLSHAGRAGGDQTQNRNLLRREELAASPTKAKASGKASGQDAGEFVDRYDGPEPTSEEFELGPPPPCGPRLCRQQAVDLSMCPFQKALGLARKLAPQLRHGPSAAAAAPPVSRLARMSLSRNAAGRSGDV